MMLEAISPEAFALIFPALCAYVFHKTVIDKD